jgi:hypothetical protein
MEGKPSPRVGDPSDERTGGKPLAVLPCSERPRASLPRPAASCTSLHCVLPGLELSRRANVLCNRWLGMPERREVGADSMCEEGMGWRVPLKLGRGSHLPF